MKQTVYGVEWKEGESNRKMVWLSSQARDAFVQRWEAGQELPQVERITVWEGVAEVPVFGIDYGPGSVKRRFGGGRVPRGAYQFRG